MDIGHINMRGVRDIGPMFIKDIDGATGMSEYVIWDNDNNVYKIYEYNSVYGIISHEDIKNFSCFSAIIISKFLSVSE
jgi:hypothetical protein